MAVAEDGGEGVTKATQSSTTDLAADEINALHRKCLAAACEALRYSIEIGQKLIEKKKALGHGKFGRWIKEACEFGRATAYRYMMAAQFSETVKLDFSPVRQLPNLSHVYDIPKFMKKCSKCYILTLVSSCLAVLKVLTIRSC
jgi:hypothetical protein